MSGRIRFAGQHSTQSNISANNQTKKNEHKAKIALDKAREASLSKNRENILQSYFQDLERCYQGERESCKKVNHDMNLAIQAHTMSR